MVTPVPHMPPIFGIICGMKIAITVVCCAVGALLCAAAETPNWEARIRRDHPRMFFNAETWPAVKARAEGPARAERDALI